nr:mitochondrial fission ELM1 family protein [Neptunomonas qingdaonensis]
MNQSLGLVEALLRTNASLTYEVCPPVSWRHLLKLLISHLFTTPASSEVRLFVAAGHRTHLTLLVYKWCFGRKTNAKAVVLMQPSLPLRWFDLCLIPEHDQPASMPNVIETWGALNRVQPGSKAKNTGLILIGGPSKHFVWDESQVLNQLKQIVEHEADTDWILTTSRRTPESFLISLSAAKLKINIIPCAQTGKDWLPEQLAIAETCWVTEDSVSMVYEALTAGCRVGLIELKSKTDSRIARGLARLRASGRVRSLKQSGNPSEKVLPALAEARRCADLIIKKGWI